MRIVNTNIFPRFVVKREKYVLNVPKGLMLLYLRLSLVLANEKRRCVRSERTCSNGSFSSRPASVTQQISLYGLL